MDANMSFPLYDDDNITDGDGAMNLSCSGNNSAYYLNVSQVYPLELAVPLYGWAMPFLLLMTIVANTLVLMVLGQLHMRSPTNAVLMAMAVADMMTVVFSEPAFFYMYTLGHHADPLAPAWACYAWVHLQDTIPNLFHTASIWLTVLLALQRYIYVCHVSVARVWCTLPRVMGAVAFVFVLATVHQAPRLFEMVYSPMEIEHDGACTEVCQIKYMAWVEVVGLDLYYSIYFIFRVMFVHLGPCFVLVVLNVLLYRALRQAQQRRSKLFKENDKKKECKKLRDDCTTLMLIVVVTVFLVTEIPLAVITFLHVLSAKEILEVFSAESYYNVLYFFIISNSFIIFSFPLNFAIYCGMSRQFRETFRDLFIRGKRMGREGSTRYSTINGPPRTCSTEV